MSTTKTTVITPQVIENAMSYSAYRSLVNELLEENKATGDDHSEEIVHYSKMNVQRMSRLDKRTKLNDSLKKEIASFKTPSIWLVITEGWCGDAAQNIPVLYKMAQASENIDICFILRDEHVAIIDEYLTNGGRSIPKLICLNADTLQEIGTWGPRPAVIQQKAMAWKNDDAIDKMQWAEKLHKWYADDKTQELQKEFEQLMKEWSRV